MKRQLVWLDLCSGLGGASQPAKDRGWKVIRVDNNAAFEPDVVADIIDPFQTTDLVKLAASAEVGWASPVCTEFTKASLPKSWACNRIPPAPDTKLSEQCWAIIQCAKWPILENVRGSRKYLEPLFGPIAGQVAGHCFWGRLPCLLPQTKGHKWKLPPSPDRAAKRAMIPYEIGEAICIAVERRRGCKFD